MLTSLALIFILGSTLGSIFQKLKLPSLLGMLLSGMILSPYALNLLDPSILLISADLRKLALIIILTRAGLSLDVQALKKVGRPAILMCFIPATFEIVGIILFAPRLLGITLVEAAIIGSVLAAVSPAVIVPRMVKLIEEGYGTRKSIPELILAGASVDDVYVIVLFTAFVALGAGESVTMGSFVQIPISIMVGLAVGLMAGIILNKLFQKCHFRDSAKVVVILSVSFLFLELEHQLTGYIPMSGLLAVMSMGLMLYQRNHTVAKRLSIKLSKLWVGAEIILFVLVGATVDLTYALAAGFVSIIVVMVGILFRMLGVLFCLIKTDLNKKERVFCMIAYTPKATVQAAIGAIPLSMGLPSGHIVLAIAVLAILITAPLGALGIDKTYHKLLKE